MRSWSKSADAPGPLCFAKKLSGTLSSAGNESRLLSSCTNHFRLDNWLLLLLLLIAPLVTAPLDAIRASIGSGLSVRGRRRTIVIVSELLYERLRETTISLVGTVVTSLSHLISTTHLPTVTIQADSSLRSALFMSYPIHTPFTTHHTRTHPPRYTNKSSNNLIISQVMFVIKLWYYSRVIGNTSEGRIIDNSPLRSTNKVTYAFTRCNYHCSRSLVCLF